MAMTAKTQTGLDFQDLAKGGERNYSCSFLVNLDPDLMSLTNPGGISLTRPGTPSQLTLQGLLSKSDRGKNVKPGFKNQSL